MTFADQLKAKVAAIWDAQFTHPFVTALGAGTLPERKFKYYILQDARYLEELARVFAAGAQKATDPETALHFATLVKETIVVERGLHEQYGRRWNLSSEDMRRTPLAPTNFAYTRHMRSVVLEGGLGEITAVALPCAWIYCDIGRHLLRNGPVAESHPYRDWLQMYASPDFAEVAEWLRNLLDGCAGSASAHELARIEDAFLISARYEWMFWEMAWREEAWPVSI
ncbi:MAG: thiaminase II [Nitrospirae bacterium]|nr:MAG: thiaminase II [Nitrospirota bacterium]